jgi:two-component system CheB/CheR fusion protein
VFHYALKPRGSLFLGSAENIAGRNDLFDTVDASARLYRRRGAHRQSVAMPLFIEPLALSAASAEPKEASRQTERADVATRRVMERYAPPHVIVNLENEIVRASARTSRYLELAEGAPSNRITDLAKRGLRSAIRAVLESTRRTRKRTIQRDVRVEWEEERAFFVDVCADPLNEEETLLVFLDAGVARNGDGDTDVDVQAEGASQDERIKQIEDELDETRSRLRTTVEELETSNEELKSSNEEMMSMNEELQSANEELATVNEELKNKVDQLARTNADLQNFIESTQVPTIFLDRKMRIRSFTPATRSLFRFQDQDRGRLFSDVVSRTDQRRLEELGRQVLETGEPVEEELSLDDGNERYVLRVLPYRGVDGAIDGVILVFADVTKVRQAQADVARTEGLARQRSHEIETLYRTAPVGMAMLDRNGRFLRMNRHFADLTAHSIDALTGRTLEDMVPALAERMKAPIEEVFAQAKEVANLDVTVRINGEAARDFLIDFYPYEEDRRVAAVGVIVKDVTELRRLEKELRRLMDELQHRVKNTLATVASIVNQTVGTKSERTELIDTLKKRIGALAATHNLLTTHDWRDASLEDILNAELTPYDHRERIHLAGPTVRLPPKHALTLTLTLHELATNAAKYGALAHAGGRLSVEWMVNVDGNGRRLTLHWIESGVPEIVLTQIRQGFGSRLIKSAVSHDLQGQCDYRLQSGGLTCTLTLPF